jgi:hypothetical protein
MSEVEAFGILLQIMGRVPSESCPFPVQRNLTSIISRKFSIRTLFTPDMSGLHVALFQLSVLIHKFIPRLYKHFDKLQVTATMYACQWFLTLFSYSVPLQLVFRIYDLMFAEGIMPVLMRVSVALLKRNEKLLLDMTDLETILGHLKGIQLLEIYGDSFNLLLQDTIALSKQITMPALEELQSKYVTEEQKCAVAVSKREHEFLKSQSAELQAKVNKGDRKLIELQDSNLELQDTVFKYKQKLIERESDNVRLQKESEELKAKLQNFEIVLNEKLELERENCRLKESMDTITSEKDSLKKNIVEWETRLLSFLESERDFLDTQSRLEKENQTLKETVMGLNSTILEYKATQNENELLKQRVLELERNFDMSAYDIETKRQEVVQLDV